MIAKAIAQVQTESRTDNQLQQNIIQGMFPLLNNQLAITSFMRAQVLASGANTINHGLPQPPVGMIVTYSSASLNVYAQSYTATKAIFTTSGAATADILFF